MEAARADVHEIFRTTRHTRHLKLNIAAPARDVAAGLHGAGMGHARANLREGGCALRGRLALGIISPAFQRAVGADGADVGVARAELRKSAGGGAAIPPQQAIVPSFFSQQV